MPLRTQNLSAVPRRVRVLSCALIIATLSALTSRSEEPLRVGYALLTSDPGTAVPVAAALFSFTKAGVLVSQAGVGAADPISSGRIFVDQVGANTGVALVNASSQNANLTFTLRDSSGKEVDRKTDTLGAGKHSALFVFPDIFSSLAPGFTGTLTFASDQKLAAISLRESRNSRNDPLYTTLPVIDLAGSSAGQSLVFPQIAAGAGYTTQILLMNTTSQKISGRITLTDSAGLPLALTSSGTVSSQFAYQIEPQGSLRTDLDKASGSATGYALVTPDTGSQLPAGSAVFQYKANGFVVTEAGVGAVSSTTSARMFLDYVGSFTGIALANPSDQPTTVTFSLLDRFGAVQSVARRDLPPRGHIAIFAHELFPSVTDGFTGLLDISATAAVAPITLKLTINKSGDQVLTTLPVADLKNPPVATNQVFPQIAIGAGFSTRLVFLSTTLNKSVSGSLSFFQSTAVPLSLPLGGKVDSRFSYQVPAGGGRQLFPGNSALVAKISVLDPATNSQTDEVIVNESQSVRPNLFVLDTDGQARDDFDLSFSSLSLEFATVDATGNIQGKKAGFSTLTITSGSILSVATITVVSISTGPPGFEITGLVQDQARRLYLANTNLHTILLAQDLTQTPALYAGKAQSAGLKNDLRLESQFRSPSFLAFNQADGSLYVSDSANNIVRRIQAGPTGKVETLAGSSTAGSSDGTALTARFSNPQGVALDSRGFLWVADAGNHTVRRINLAARTVETIAGKAGLRGSADGAGSQARFDSPMGLALESETRAQQLEREFKGLPPPPVSILVADKGNGLIRRVKSTGAVETITVSAALANAENNLQGAPSYRERRIAARFTGPAAVYQDPLGNIYVTEPDSQRVSVILAKGKIVPASQANTFSSPRALFISRVGKVVIADGKNSAREISYGAPQIDSVTPSTISVRGSAKVTIRGKNFSPDTIAIVAETILQITVQDSETIFFTAPVFPSGRTTLTLQNRGGVAQTLFAIDPIPFSQLPQGYITTVAGGSTYSGDGLKAVDAPVVPVGLAIDPSGNVLVVDGSRNGIRKIDARTGIITTIAGNGAPDSSGDGELATAAALFPAYPGPGAINSTIGLGFDSDGNLYVVDGGRVRVIQSSTGIISTFAGGEYGYCGDGGDAKKACMINPQGMAVDAKGNVYVAETGNHTIRKVDGRTGVISTIAGTGKDGYSGDKGPAAKAELNSPTGLAVDAEGNLFVADSGNNRVRRIDALTAVITSVAGDGDGGYSLDLGDNGPALSAHMSPVHIAFDLAGNLYIADIGNSRIRRVNATNQVITTVAGGGPRGFSGDGGPAISSGLYYPNAVAIDASGNLYIADDLNYRIRKVDTATGIISTVAGNGQRRYADENGPATAATLVFPTGLALDNSGNLYIADASNDGWVRKVDASTGIISAFAGGGNPQEGIGDGGLALNAYISPRSIALDNDGNLYIADGYNYVVRRVDARTRIITTIAGTGTGGFSGDGGQATSADLGAIYGIAFDSSNNLYIADEANGRVRKVNLATGIIISVAGGGNPSDGRGDGGPATKAAFAGSFSIAIDADGNLIIADSDRGRIRKVDSRTQIITTIAGGGESIDDNVDGSKAQMFPDALAVDSNGNIFYIDFYLGAVRRFDVKTGKVASVVSGKFLLGFQGDGGPAIDATLSYPSSITFDRAGNLYIADTNFNRVRAVKGPLQ